MKIIISDNCKPLFIQKWSQNCNPTVMEGTTEYPTLLAGYVGKIALNNTYTAVYTSTGNSREQSIWDTYGVLRYFGADGMKDLMKVVCGKYINHEKYRVNLLITGKYMIDISLPQLITSYYRPEIVNKNGQRSSKFFSAQKFKF